MSAAAAAVIVGRERELALLDDFVGGRERPAALVLQGEAGIGKTVLWEAAVERAHGSAQVLACRPSEAELLLAFSALTDLLGPVAATVLPGLPPPQRRALGVALLLEIDDGPPPDVRAIGSALVAALHVLARERPLLVAVDDVQWLDRASAAALAFACRRLGDESIALLLARRSGSDEPLPLELDRSFRDGRLARLDLGPLSLGALHRTLSSRLGVTLTRPMLRRVHSATGGNPYYALEVARAFRERGGRIDPTDPLPVPATLHELVRDRLAAQPPAVRETVAAVALLADPTLEAVEAAVPASGAVDDAIEAGVLRANAARLELTHPLLAVAALAVVGPQARRAMHRRLASVVDDRESRARHLAAATDGPSSDVARALEEAARAAASRGATDAAADLAERALELTPAADQTALARRRLTAAENLILSGDLPRARELLRPVLEHLPPGLERARALFHVGWAASDESDESEQVRILEQALAEAVGDETLQAEIEHALAVLHYVLGNRERGAAHERAAVARARRADDPLLLVRSIAALARSETYYGTVTPGLLEEALTLERALDRLPDHYSSPSAVMGLRLMYADRVDDARRFLEQAHRRALGAGDEPSRPGLLLHLSELEHRAGRWQRAREHAEEGLQLSEQLDLRQSRSALLFARAYVDAHLGRLDAARADAEEGLALARTIGDDVFALQNLAVLGFIGLSAGNHAEAATLLRPVLDGIVERGWREPTVSRIVPNALEALIHVGETQPAVAALEWLERQTETFDAPWAPAQAARSRGLLAASSADYPAAVEHYERALREHGRTTSSFERGRTLVAYGTLLRRMGQKRSGREHLAQACTIFDELGAVVWADNARAELARFGGRAATSGELTPTERRVAELVANGRTNPEVAVALFVTRQTVEKHLTRVYAKLGLRSRTELARRFGNESSRP